MKVIGEKNGVNFNGVNQDQKAREARLKEATENFEAIFLNFMLKSMLKTSDGKESIFGGNSFGADILDSVFLFELSRHIAKNGKFGIAELIYEKLKDRDVETQNVEPKSEKKVEERSVRGKFLGAYGSSLVERVNRFENIIKGASEKFGVPVELIKAIIAVESSGNVFALSERGAKGLMQLLDSTAELVGVKNVWHPAENIYGAVKYLRMLIDEFGDIKLALAGYNAGPENVKKYGGIPPFPETVEYVGKVIKYMKLFETTKKWQNNE